MIDFGERKRENRTTHAGEEGKTNIREEEGRKWGGYILEREKERLSR